MMTTIRTLAAVALAVLLTASCAGASTGDDRRPAAPATTARPAPTTTHASDNPDFQSCRLLSETIVELSADGARGLGLRPHHNGEPALHSGAYGRQRLRPVLASGRPGDGQHRRNAPLRRVLGSCGQPTVPFVVDGCSINGAAGLVVPAALRRTVLRFAVCGWVPSGVARSYAPVGVAGESLRVLSHSHGLRVGWCASSPHQPQHQVVWVWWGSRSV